MLSKYDIYHYMDNLILIDKTIYDIHKFTDSIKINTKYIVYSNNDTFDTLLQQITNFNIEKFTNLAFAFVFDDFHNKLFIDNKYFISTNKQKKNKKVYTLETENGCPVMMSGLSVVAFKENTFDNAADKLNITYFINRCK